MNIYSVELFTSHFSSCLALSQLYLMELDAAVKSEKKYLGTGCSSGNIGFNDKYKYSTTAQIKKGIKNNYSQKPVRIKCMDTFTFIL